MIYHAIIGTERVTHLEIQSFLKGFLMPCHSGLTFIFTLSSVDSHAYDSITASLSGRGMAGPKHF